VGAIVQLSLSAIKTGIAACIRGKLPMRQAAWYVKAVPTFSDALTTVRAHWWRAIGLSTSRCERDIIKVPRNVWRRLHEAACYAA
jgi:hypothetical protein